MNSRKRHEYILKIRIAQIEAKRFGVRQLIKVAQFNSATSSLRPLGNYGLAKVRSQRQLSSSLRRKKILSPSAWLSQLDWAATQP